MKFKFHIGSKCLTPDKVIVVIDYYPMGYPFSCGKSRISCSRTGKIDRVK